MSGRGESTEAVSSASDVTLSVPSTASWTHAQMWEDIRSVLGECSKNKSLVGRFHTSFWLQHSHDQRDLLAQQWQCMTNLSAGGGKQRALGFLRMLMPRVGTLLCLCSRDVVVENVLLDMKKRRTQDTEHGSIREIVKDNVHRYISELSHKRRIVEAERSRAVTEA